MTNNLPESPLDVLSRAATMVENNMDSKNSSSSSSSNDKCERSPSFKERHPKFRKSSTPDYLVAAAERPKIQRQQSTNASSSPPPPHTSHSIIPRIGESIITTSYPTIRTSYPTVQPTQNGDDTDEEVDVVNEVEEEGPIDMSMKKRPSSPSPPPPPPYRPLINRRRSPPPPYRPFTSSSASSLPPPPSYPANIAAAVAAMRDLPPPPSYESSTAAKRFSDPTPNSNTSRRIIDDNKENKTVREITIITDSCADPLLDEHFRRSLGANYKYLFKKDSPERELSKSPPPAPVSPRSPVSITATSTITTTTTSSSSSSNESSSSSSSITEDNSSSSSKPISVSNVEGYTVEDHFAKALGDTWLKLQAKTASSSTTTTTKDSNKATESPKSPASTSTTPKTTLVV